MGTPSPPPADPSPSPHPLKKHPQKHPQRKVVMTVAPRRRRRRRRPPSKLCPIIYGSIHLPADPKLTSTNRFDLILANSLNAKNDYSHKYLLPMNPKNYELIYTVYKKFLCYDDYHCT